jgi:arylformamidase
MPMTTITIENSAYRIRLNQPISLAMELSSEGARAWYVAPMRIAPVLLPYVTGSVALGGNVNFNEVQFNPHGHGTHTETVGHIAREEYPIAALQLPFLMSAQLISIAPDEVVEDNGWSKSGDRIITCNQMQLALGDRRPEAVVVRTWPNSSDKKTTNYSGTNFCYFEPEALAWLAAIGVQHLLVDLPSVDREEDGGALLAHRAFWQYPQHTRANCTITELIFVPDEVIDGSYLLHLSWPPFRNDAAPSVPVLFAAELMDGLSE